MTPRIGAALEYLGDPIPLSRLRALAGVGFDHSVIMHGLDIEPWPEERRWSWSLLDHNISAVREAGMDVGLRLMWLPRHMTEGNPMYEERYAEKHNLFDHPKPSIDRDKLRRVTDAILDRYGDDIRWLQIWNEPGGNTYLPDIHGAGVTVDPDVAMTKLEKRITVPIIEAVERSPYRIAVSGPEADGADVFNRMLGKIGAEYDYFTWHPYGRDGETAEEALDRTGAEFLPWFERHRHHGLARVKYGWFSEVGRVPIVEWTRLAVDRYSDWLYAISFYERREWDHLAAQLFRPGTLDLSEDGEKMKDLIASLKMQRKRRTVRT